MRKKYLYTDYVYTTYKPYYKPYYINLSTQRNSPAAPAAGNSGGPRLPGRGHGSIGDDKPTTVGISWILSGSL